MKVRQGASTGPPTQSRPPGLPANAVRFNPFGPDGDEFFDRHYSPQHEKDNSTGQALAVVGGLATAAGVTFLTLTLARSIGRKPERQPPAPTLSLSAGAIRSGLGMGLTGAF